MEIKELIDHIGNKIPFEKAKYYCRKRVFCKKQASYAETEVEILHAISTQHNSWGLDEIRERETYEFLMNY